MAADGSIFYNAKGICGCIQERKCRASGTTIQVLHVEQAGFDKDDEDYSYVTICLDHGFLVYHQTLSKAIDHAAYPEWCAECQENLR